MHEASLVEGLLNIIRNSIEDYKKQSSKPQGIKIQEVVCEIGVLAQIEKETLKACFEIFVEGTELDGTQLRLETRPLECECRNCNKAFQLYTSKLICPFCNSEDIKFDWVGGMTLKEINVQNNL